MPFELAAGMNGRLWIKARSPKQTIFIANAIYASEYMLNEQIKAMCSKLGNVSIGTWDKNCPFPFTAKINTSEHFLQFRMKGTKCRMCWRQNIKWHLLRYFCGSTNQMNSIYIKEKNLVIAIVLVLRIASSPCWQEVQWIENTSWDNDRKWKWVINIWSF